MMLEAHVGVKPGKPALLLLASAAVLVGTFGLAWVQIRATRALGEEVAVEGTPLIVRAPEGWVRGSDPGLFGKLVQKQVWGTRIWAAERTVEFRYNEYFKQFVRMFQAVAVQPPTRGDIGDFPGVQCIVNRLSSQSPGQSIHRWAPTPDGALLGVSYTPLAEISHGDVYLLEEICRSVQVKHDSSPSTSPRNLPARCGLSFELSPEWELLGPNAEERPGFWILKRDDGRPRWAMGVYRGYLGRTQDPMDLLVSEARQLWPAFERPGGRRRDDGVFVGLAVGPGDRVDGNVAASVWLVAKTTVEAAVVYVLVDPRYTDEANRTAYKITEEMTFNTSYPG